GAREGVPVRDAAGAQAPPWRGKRSARGADKHVSAASGSRTGGRGRGDAARHNAGGAPGPSRSGRVCPHRSARPLRAAEDAGRSGLAVTEWSRFRARSIEGVTPSGAPPEATASADAEEGGRGT